jgi:hypothetical protein
VLICGCFAVATNKANDCARRCAIGIRRGNLEVTALLALRPLSEGELKRVSRVLAAEGLGDVRPTRIALAPDDAKAVAAGERKLSPRRSFGIRPLCRRPPVTRMVP